jgi:proteasome lid subunit RPN8/RPN11
MDVTYLPAPGELADPASFAIPRARELAGVLAASLPYVKTLEFRRAGDDEVIVVELEIEIGQRVTADIRRFERVAILIPKDDEALPDTLTLRADFPVVAHLNLRHAELPRSLCLYEGHPAELLLGWTPRKYLERIREWLARTAKQELHAEDQPLEPLLIGPLWPLVIPSDIFGDDVTQTALQVTAVEGADGRPVLIAEREKKEDRPGSSGDKSLRCVALALLGEPQLHGIIRSQPQSLFELHQFLSAAKIDLIGRLRDQLRIWREDPRAVGSRLIIIVGLPKTRHGGAEAEATDFWAFVTGAEIREVGQELGLWKIEGRFLPVTIGGDDTKRGETVEVALLDPQTAFSRQRAAFLNGFPDPVAFKVVGVGMGALGSQVFMNLLRGGFGEWTLVDNDHLLPHNLARHQLSGWALGHPKVMTLAYSANGMIEGKEIATPVVIDALKSAESEPLTKALAEADMVLDFSASVAVARHLARGVESGGRRISLFMNPAGSDLVLLAEDEKRTVRLDCLEMQYHRLLATEASLSGHLAEAPNFRYGPSCRDVSSTMPQHLVALHAAVGAKAMRDAAADAGPRIVVWRSDPDQMTVSRLAFAPSPMIEIHNAGWTLCTDQSVIEKVMRLHREKLPKETGGILIGSFDMKRKIVYVADAEASPPGSREEPTLYIRGSEGMTARLAEIESATAGNLEYVGEWHSHPAGYDCTPSDFDLRLFAWLVELMSIDGRPALMLIAGEPGTAWFLGRMA